MIIEDTFGAEVPTVRRVRRVFSQFERLARPADVRPGDAMPSIEGWVLFLTNLPPNTTADHVTDIFLDPGVAGGDLGPVREVRLPLNRDCACCGYALVELERRDAFERALVELQGRPLPFAEGQPPAGEDEWRLRIAPTFLGEEVEEEAPRGAKRGRDGDDSLQPPPPLPSWPQGGQQEEAVEAEE